MEKINIVNLLKECPKGMKLYTTVWGDVELIKLTDTDMITVLPISSLPNTSNTKLLYSDGRFTISGECVLFPSKENRDWSKFHRPFKDGDILTNEYGNIFIYKGPMWYNKLLADSYCGYRISDGAFISKLFKDKHFGDVSECRFATKKEKQKLFQAIKDNGYKWNPETKTLEKLPKFKVGDRIKPIGLDRHYTIKNIKIDRYILNDDKFLKFTDEHDFELVPNKVVEPYFKAGDKIKDTRNNSEGIIEKIDKENCTCLFDYGRFYFPITELDYFELVPNKSDITSKLKFKVGDTVRCINNIDMKFKIIEITDNYYLCENNFRIYFKFQEYWEICINDKFNINTLKPFESKVLVRSVDGDLWKPAVYGFPSSKGHYVVGGIHWKQCIPYKGNEYLLRKTDDCNDYYKTWLNNT